MKNLLIIAPELFAPLNVKTVKDELQLRLLQAADLSQASLLLQSNWLEVIVIPLSLGGQIVLPFIESCLAQNPEVQIVIVVNRDQINSAATAMQAGVADCLFRPFSSDRFMKTILRARERSDATPYHSKNAPSARGKFASSFSSRPNARPSTKPKIDPAQTNAPVEEIVTPPVPGEIPHPSESTEPLQNLLEGRTFAQIERLVIEAAIKNAGGSVTQAAKTLDVAPSTLYRKRQGWDGTSR